MDVRVPQLAEGVTSGTVVSLLVKEGESVKKEQTLLELETNKAVATIPSPGEGTIAKILVSEGDEVAVGSVLMSLSADGAAPVEASQPAAAVPSPSAPASIPAPAAAVQQSPVQTTTVQAPVTYQYQSLAGSPPPASPSIRKMAFQLGIDLMRVKGSENGGRIVLEDVKNYIQFLQAKAFSETGSSAASGTKPAKTVDFSKWGEVSRKKMSRLRRTISEQMSDCWRTIPHVTQFDDASLDALMKLRKKYVEDYKKAGASLTVTTFVLKAVVDTLKKHPIFNASIDEATDEVVYKEYYNLGIAVDTDQGLIVPVIRNVDRKNLFELSLELADLAARTRDRKVSMDDLQGASFTISNQGGIGGTHFTPIVNKPEVAILGLGKGGIKPVVKDGKITTGLTMPVALSYDHRLIDGGSAARFMTDFCLALQNFTDADLKLTGSKQSSQKKASPNKSKKRGKK
ncbi:MAG: 2-oxo acid dehydrogenase subunit E2 [Candidatus Omnitrophica bacterium]|nr:2-oxo acid dehydrogenase subunit E2 [Candidatus Omnitrophota bacterium]